MSANSPQYRVVGLVAVLVVAGVVPALGPSAAGTSAASSASFSPSVVYEERGDVAEITVNTDGGGMVNIGSPSNAFWLRIQVGGGTKTIELNTYKAGVAKSGPEMKSAVSGGTVVDYGLSDLNKALVASEYTMNVTKNGNEVGVGALVIEKRDNYDVTTRIAPGAVAEDEFDSKDGVRKHFVAPRGTVAHEDWLLVRANVTGVAGVLRADPSKTSVARVEFTQLNPPVNEDANEFALSLADAITFENEEGFSLTVDTGKHGIEPGQRYRVEFVVPQQSPLAEKRQNVSTEITVVERRVELERNGPGKAVVVEGKTTLRGTTTLTPGATVNLSARDSDLPPFNMFETPTVTENRTFSTTFDFSDIEPGRDFEIRLEDERIPGQVAIALTTTATETPKTTATTVQTETTATTTTETVTTATTTAAGLTQAPVDETAKPLTQRASENGSDDGDRSDGGNLVPVPGFGPVAGLVALLAGGLAAARRR